MRKWNIDCMPYMSGVSVGVVGKGFLLHIDICVAEQRIEGRGMYVVGAGK